MGGGRCFGNKSWQDSKLKTQIPERTSACSVSAPPLCELYNLCGKTISSPHELK